MLNSMCDKISMALAAQWVASLSINDLASARRLAVEFKRRWSMEQDAQGFGGEEQQEADDAHPSKHLEFEVS
jgi:hypothetical protein